MQDSKSKQSAHDQVNEELLAKATRELMESRLAQLDVSTLSQLAKARRLAIDSIKQPKRFARFDAWMLPAGSIAATVAIAVLLVSLFSSKPILLEPTPIFEDIQLLSSTENLELLQELDFYEWLAYEQEIG